MPDTPYEQPAAAEAPLVPTPPVAEQPAVGDQPLPPRRQRFVDEYLIDLNGTQAAIRAGYAVETAALEASRLLRDVHVANAVATAKAQRASRVAVTADSVLHEMSLLANSSIDHYYVDDHGNLRPTPDAPAGAMRAVQSVKKTTKIDKDDNITYVVEFKLWDKPQPLRLMGRHIGLFADRVEHTGLNGGPIEATITKVERVVVDPSAANVTDPNA